GAVWVTATVERDRAEQQLLATARALVHSLDREFGQAGAMLAALSVLPALEAGDLDRFDAQLRRALDGRWNGVLTGAEGRLLVMTAVRREAVTGAAAATGAPDHLRRVIEGEGLHISPLYRATLLGEPVVQVSRRVLLAGEPASLGLVIRARELGAILRQQRMPESWVAAVLDPEDRVVARTRAEDSFIGQVATPRVREALARGPEGVIPHAPSHDGVPSTIVARSAESGFAVAIAAPAPSFLGQTVADLAGTAAIALLLLALSALLAHRVARQLRDGIVTLVADRGRQARRGTEIREIAQVAAALDRADAARERAAEELRRSEARYRVTLEAFAGGVYEWEPGAGRVTRSPGVLALLGEAADTPDPGWGHERMHPEDRPRVLALRERVARGEADRFDTEYRVRHADGGWRWVWDRGMAQRDGAGRLLRVIGSVMDVSARHEAEAARERIARELDHRVKNIFALVGSVLHATAAAHPEAGGFVLAFARRLRALSVAHDAIRQGARAEGVTLHGLLARLAAPHGGAPRVAAEGDDFALAPGAVTHLALVLHELLTNAAKHGALAEPGGQVRLHARVTDDACAIAWTERGGPPVPGPPAERGFGSRLIEATVTGPLEGRLEEHWEREGLRVDLTLPLAGLRAADGAG
ncbi:MAG TPA: PAS domain-containing protein, partial [Acetobacteraceae bacterium]|nr:PAS domain-containing protein [Acetobacteraceae bacterium]